MLCIYIYTYIHVYGCVCVCHSQRIPPANQSRRKQATPTCQQPPPPTTPSPASPSLYKGGACGTLGSQKRVARLFSMALKASHREPHHFGGPLKKGHTPILRSWHPFLGGKQKSGAAFFSPSEQLRCFMCGAARICFSAPPRRQRAWRGTLRSESACDSPLFTPLLEANVLTQTY